MAKKILNYDNLNLPISAFKIEEIKLNEFYKKIFSLRSCRLENLWKWLYRTNFFSEKKNPMIILKKNEVAGHMGTIPFWLNLEGRKVLASWYADMYVLHKHRGEGLAKKITIELMKNTEIGFGFGNEKSMSIFKKFGWLVSREGYIHHFFLQPMNHVRFNIFRKYFSWIYYIINFIFKHILSNYYLIKKNKNNQLYVEEINNENIKIFLNIKKNNNLINTILDENYLKWRFLESPDLKSYKIFKSNNNIAAIVKERKDKLLTWHLDILLINDLSNNQIIISFLADIVLWGKKHNFSYIRVYISDKDLSRKINYNLLSIYSNPKFFYFSKNKTFMNILNKGNYLWQLSDSDWEIIS